MVAHDFRSPLMAIRGFAEMVLEELGPRRRDAASSSCRRSSTRRTTWRAWPTTRFLITQMETGHFDVPLDARSTWAPSSWTRSRAGAPTIPVGIDVPERTSPPDRRPRAPAPGPHQPDRRTRSSTRRAATPCWCARASPPAGTCRSRSIDHGLGIPRGPDGAALPEVRARAHRAALRVIGGTGPRPLHLPPDRRGRTAAASGPSRSRAPGSTFLVLLPLDPRKTKAGAARPGRLALPAQHALDRRDRGLDLDRRPRARAAATRGSASPSPRPSARARSGWRPRCRRA